LQFGTNVSSLSHPSITSSQCLGHQRLISLLLPLLQESSKINGSSSRIIISSSAGHSAAPLSGVDYLSVLRDHSSGSTESNPIRGRNERSSWVEYGQSKWGNIAVCRWVHWAYGPDQGRQKRSIEGGRGGEGSGEVVSISVHPGMFLINLGIPH
jgi:NAD(P)-dependent dehydrogenase (short-subunit alcohol dehydrogenase family)